MCTAWGCRSVKCVLCGSDVAKFPVRRDVEHAHQRPSMSPRLTPGIEFGGGRGKKVLNAPEQLRVVTTSRIAFGSPHPALPYLTLP